MTKPKNIALDFEIDKLTNSIENTLTGESYPTEVLPLSKGDLTKIKAEKTFGFDWGKENKRAKSVVYKLTTNLNPHVIHGLLSIEIRQGYVYMALIESAKFNRGKNKIYLGVPGNLVAFACKLAFEKGFDGAVSFYAKTRLIEHYKKTLYADHAGGQLMIMSQQAGKRLIDQYFNEENNTKTE